MTFEDQAFEYVLRDPSRSTVSYGLFLQVEWDTDPGTREVQSVKSFSDTGPNEIQSITTSTDDVDEVQLLMISGDETNDVEVKINYDNARPLQALEILYIFRIVCE